MFTLTKPSHLQTMMRLRHANDLLVHPMRDSRVKVARVSEACNRRKSHPVLRARTYNAFKIAR
jgi:hypothetical protein